MERSDYPPSHSNLCTLSQRQIADCQQYGRWRGLRILKQTVDDNNIGIMFINSRNKLVVALDLSLIKKRTRSGLKIYEVEMMVIDRKFQGFNIGALIYREVMRRIGIIIAGGWCQSAGARFLWAKLNNLDDVVIMAGKKSVPLHEVDSDLEARELVSEQFEIYDNDAIVYAFTI